MICDPAENYLSFLHLKTHSGEKSKKLDTHGKMICNPAENYLPSKHSGQIFATANILIFVAPLHSSYASYASLLKVILLAMPQRVGCNCNAVFGFEDWEEKRTTYSVE